MVVSSSQEGGKGASADAGATPQASAATTTNKLMKRFKAGPGSAGAKKSSRGAADHEDEHSSATSTDSSTRSSQSAASKLSKIGQRLRDSCRNLRAKHGSGGSSNSPDDYTSIQAHNESQKSKYYVPMDFSGKEGPRIVDWSDLPANCPTKEGYTYFRRKCMSTNVKNLLTETQDTVHLNQPWFHKGVSRDLSQKILSTHAIDGAFLVRNSSVNGGFVISYYSGGKSHHAQALPDAVDGCVTYSLDEGRTRFFDLLQMVEFYQLNRGTLSHRLTHYVISKEAALALGYDITKKPAQKPSPQPPPVPTNPEPSSPELPKTTTSQSQKVSASGDTTTNDSTPSSGTVTGAVTSIKESGGNSDAPATPAAAATANGRSHVTKDVPDDDSKISQNNNTKAAAPTNGATEVTGGSDLQ